MGWDGMGWPRLRTIFGGELITDFPHAHSSFSFVDVTRLSPEFPPRAAMWRIRRLGSHASYCLIARHV